VIKFDIMAKIKSICELEESLEMWSLNYLWSFLMLFLLLATNCVIIEIFYCSWGLLRA